MVRAFPFCADKRRAQLEKSLRARAIDLFMKVRLMGRCRTKTRRSEEGETMMFKR